MLPGVQCQTGPSCAFSCRHSADSIIDIDSARDMGAKIKTIRESTLGRSIPRVTWTPMCPFCGHACVSHGKFGMMAITNLPVRASGEACAYARDGARGGGICFVRRIVYSEESSSKRNTSRSGGRLWPSRRRRLQTETTQHSNPLTTDRSARTCR
ncbi:hypothetical protein BN931_1641 [Bifidobacterium animalis subsp. lactis CECT 8145]|nr:hypothetical protein BN931_1641 [Bifidobacterium animalis subsp. lactis CECT 8145]